ncbi:hypothetical protein Q7C36_010733 [Tachysurus vachellii]|uniref:Uncharacterized protein n=1 Tax=Tachysurus vachellii TaxID=175792 RepID=A0AA88MY67_TACVA|nr:hypothetical protein Q7C36_010733 [Tachysurus vachellii]
MSVHGSKSSLTITAVNVSDTGLYYCSFTEKMIFSNSTYLQVKGIKKTFSESLDKATGSVSPAVFFMLIVVFVSVTVFLLCVLIFIILKHRKTHRDAEDNAEISNSDAVNYAALQFSKKKTKRNKRHDVKEDPCVVYSSVGQSHVCT